MVSPDQDVLVVTGELPKETRDRSSGARPYNRTKGRRSPRRTAIAHLEELTKGATVAGITPDALVTVVDVQWRGSTAVELTYKTAAGQVARKLLFRDDEPRIEIAEAGRPWAFDGDGETFRLVAEAKRIDLAYLFDPYVAVTTALVEPLPHQITAVYEELLTRQPLSFLLADDPGAGKTIHTR